MMTLSLTETSPIWSPSGDSSQRLLCAHCPFLKGIILDDKNARKIAADLGIKVIGTLGLLILAKQKGFLTEVRPIMAQIIERVNFRIAPSVLNRALSLIDELLL